LRTGKHFDSTTMGPRPIRNGIVLTSTSGIVRAAGDPATAIQSAESKRQSPTVTVVIRCPILISTTIKFPEEQGSRPSSALYVGPEPKQSSSKRTQPAGVGR